MSIIPFNCNRRFLLAGAAAWGATAVFPARAADPYPKREIRLIVPWGPGGSVDITARMIARLVAADGLNVIVDNQPGATGAIGLAKVAAAPGDGYTLGIATTSQLALVAQGLTKTRNDQFTVLNQVSEEQFLLLVPKDGPAQTLEDFLALMKKNPDKISIGTAGSNNLPQILGATTAELAGTTFIHVPYPGGAKVIGDLAGRQIDAAILKPSESKGQIDAGLIKPLAVFDDKRVPSRRDVPTFKEKGLDIYTSGRLSQMSWLVAPAKTPPAIVDRLTAAFAKAVKSSEYARFATDNGFTATDVMGKQLEAQVAAVQQTLNVLAPKVFKK